MSRLALPRLGILELSSTLNCLWHCIEELRLARPPRIKSDQGVLVEKMSESKVHIMDGGALGKSEE